MWSSTIVAQQKIISHCSFLVYFAFAHIFDWFFFNTFLWPYMLQDIAQWFAHLSSFWSVVWWCSKNTCSIWMHMSVVGHYKLQIGKKEMLSGSLWLPLMWMTKTIFRLMLPGQHQESKQQVMPSLDVYWATCDLTYHRRAFPSFVHFPLPFRFTCASLSS